MAITITQQPTSPNAAYTRLLNVVSGSTNTGNPQYSYLMDVYESGSSDKIVRIIQGINPAGVSVFDPSRIIQGQLAEDQSWKISSVTPFESGSKLFTLKFGEQYGTSDSSSITEYPDLAENVIEVFRGVVEPNDGSYNWPSSSYAVLSNMPSSMSMQYDDYGTISVYNSDNAYVSQSFYSGSDSGIQLIQQKNYDLTDSFSSVPISSSTPYWNYVDVEVSSSLGIQNYRYEVSDETHREKVRFAFINKLGSWDYFNNYNPVQQTTAVNREQYTANRVDYSSLTSTYDITRRGLSDFHTSVDDSFTVQTDYLDKENANWLEELIESPSVFIQRDGEFVPIVILNSSYTANTNQARQKLFQYTLEFIPSNQPFGKWVPEYVECPKQQPKPPYVITEEFTNVSYLGFDLNGSVITDGGAAVVERGFAYSSQSSNPSITGSTSVKVTSGTGEGDFSSAIISASEDTVYYARAYASNSMALVYGDIQEAKTLPFDNPQVSTQAITGIETGSLTFNGTFISNGGDPSAQRGFVYNTGSNPVVTDNILTLAGGLGTYTGSVDELLEDQQYHVRAFASNSVALVYGNEVSATTLNVDPPSMTTSIYTDTPTNSSTFRAYSNVTSDGGSPVTSQGIVFSTSSTPNISSSDSIVISSSNAGTNTLLVAYPVSGSTTYNVRAWGINYAGTGYSSTVQVTTPADFNPKVGGLSNPYLHYDFTRPKFANDGVYDRSTLPSTGRYSILSLSGSTYDNLGPLTQQPHLRPPSLQTPISGSESAIITGAPYGKFERLTVTQGQILTVDANRPEVIFWKGGLGVTNNIKQYTIATYYQPNFSASDNGSAMISWDGYDTGTFTSPNINSSLMDNRTDRNNQTAYGGATNKNDDSKLIGYSATGYYSYSGSGFNGGDDTRPWMSQFVTVDKDFPSTQLSASIQRGDGGPIGSGSFIQPNRYGSAADDRNEMKFAVGAEAYTGTGTARFKIAHVVVYSGSLSSDQMGQLNASFTSSRPDLTQYFNLF
jgi:hypothetical protein